MSKVAELGLTLIDSSWARTVTLAVSLSPSSAARTVVFPALAAVNRPELLMVPTLSLLDDQLTSPVTSRFVPSENVAWASKLRRWPIFRVTELGLTVIDASRTSRTVPLAVPLTFIRAACTVVFPALIAVNCPWLSLVPTFGSLDVQSTSSVTSWFVPSENVAWASKLCCSPVSKVTELGFTAIASSRMLADSQSWRNQEAGESLRAYPGAGSSVRIQMISANEIELH